MRTRGLVALCFVQALFGRAPVGEAATLPAGFTESVYSGGLTNPTAMQFAPDGRLFVSEQGGTLRVIKNGVLLATPFVSLTVDSSGERGLLGIAFDPAFASNHFIYVYYTATTPATHNRISRFTASGDVAVPGSEVAIFDLDNLSSATNHNGGALNVGPDGKLYATAGENANGANAQTLSNVLGKVLRINTDGSIPSDNPFFATATGKNRAIWALGLRNPFTFAFNAAGSRMYLNDVGQSVWEEIDNGVAGANYGWPTVEGPAPPSTPGFAYPVYWYNHSSGSPTGCAITGGTFYEPPVSQFPASFFGDYFFADFCSGWIKKLDPATAAVQDFATGIASPVDLKVGADGALYYLARGAGAVFRVSSAATADSVTPSSGAGFSQTFTLRYSDAALATSLSSAWVWFNTDFSGSASSSCMLYLDQATNTLFLLNTAGTAYTSQAIGMPGTLTNSQCQVSVGASSATRVGSQLTLNLAMTFAAGYIGAKNVYLFAADMNGTNSGWQARGSWMVQVPPSVTADSVSPASGSGTAQTFALHFTDSAGAGDVTAAWVWFTANFGSSAANTCMAYYDRAANAVFLLNDAGTAWNSTPLGGATLQNSQCIVSAGGATVVPAGNGLTVNLPITFKSAFNGAKAVWMYGAGGLGSSSGWQNRGTWTVAGLSIGADMMTPSAGGGLTQTFAFQYSDSIGPSDLGTTWAWFNASFAASAANSCLFYYDRAANSVNLLNNAGTTWMPGTPGSGGTLSNNQCAIALGTMSVGTGANTLTVNVPITFARPFFGFKNAYMFAAGTSGNSGWQTRGSWSVPAVTADSVTPSNGSGLTTTFAVQYTATAGPSDLSTAWVWINSAFGSSGANSCMLYYDRAANLLYLLNDAGTAWGVGQAPGTRSTLSNGQCQVSTAGVAATQAGNTLTLNLPMVFVSPAFAGAKSVFAYGASAGSIGSGWQTLGTWTVP